MSYIKIQAAEKLNWMEEVKGFGDFKKVRHIVLVMVANEPVEVYKRTLEALAQQTFPLRQLAVVMATEERFPNGAVECEELRKTLGKNLETILSRFIPQISRGEIKGKSSNEAWAAREAKRVLVDKKKYDIKYITITSNDADAILHRQYFAYLTF